MFLIPLPELCRSCLLEAPLHIAVPKETRSRERRVACSPEAARGLVGLGYTLGVETGAGAGAHFSDNDWQRAGAQLVPDRAQLWRDADIILKVMPPAARECSLFRKGQVLVSFLNPARNSALLKKLAGCGVSVLAMDCVPRISRAQGIDALSVMANIAGYRAVIEASHHFGRFLAGQVTAAGKIPPARVLVVGAGVAGLSAIGAARGLGAVVHAFDTRPEVAEQVQSMGARFLAAASGESGAGEGGYAREMSAAFIEAEQALLAEQARQTDIIITTALIPGKPAPQLITEDMVRAMPDGGVIVDLAAEQGGNCVLSRKNQVSEQHGVTILAWTDLPSRLPAQSSRLYANNLLHLLTLMTPKRDGVLVIDEQDEVVRSMTAARAGRITWPPPRLETPAPAAPAAPATAQAAGMQPAPSGAPAAAKRSSAWARALRTLCLLGIGGGLLFGLGSAAPPSFLQHFTVFVLACFVGYRVIWEVTPSLHTPLMSVTNAVSSIIVIGALIQIASPGILPTLLAAIAVGIASVNIAGGFAVTQRMLRMFRKK